MQKSVIEYLERTVSSFSMKLAVQDSEMSITFSELWDAARRISNAIVASGINSNNNPIGVYIPKGCKMVESFAGINMCGNFYAPLDTKSPDSRVASILTTLEAKYVITDRAHQAQLACFYNGVIWVIEDLLERTAPEGGENNFTAQIDTDPVYCIFTSGSTGTPKGVVISHRGVIDYIDWAVDTFKIDSTTVIGNQAPFYFDNSTLDIYLMLSTGATLNIIPESCFAFPSKLIDYLNDNRITFIFWVPFVLVNVANMDILEHKKPKYLNKVLFAGEVMPNKHLNYWRKRMPDCLYANLYGPTEITVDCTYYIVKRDFADDEPLPIGFLCRNSDVLILVDRKRLAAPGEHGELCVRGSSLALGYYNNPEKTSTAFIQNPLHNHYPEALYCTGDIVYQNEFGEIMYVGRVDAQIKHNGYRIELGEIETAVLGTNMVENCCVVYDYANKKIVLFYQAKAELNIADFRKVIVGSVPRYMLPNEYHREDMLRQNSSGKIDRAYYNKMFK